MGPHFSARDESRFSEFKLQNWTLASAKHQKTWRHLKFNEFIHSLRISFALLIPYVCCVGEGAGSSSDFQQHQSREQPPCPTWGEGGPGR